MSRFAGDGWCNTTNPVFNKLSLFHWPKGVESSITALKFRLSRAADLEKHIYRWHYTINVNSIRSLSTYPQVILTTTFSSQWAFLKLKNPQNRIICMSVSLKSLKISVLKTNQFYLQNKPFQALFSPHTTVLKTLAAS